MDSFINNGYDDLDIIRQIDDADLDIMLITDAIDRQDIVDTVRLLNEGINRLYNTGTYMEVEPDIDPPSGEQLAEPVSVKLHSEGITLSHQNGLFYKEDGYPCTMRDYDMLRARYAQELQVPCQSICDALTILHARPTKPPKPKSIPVYDSKSGRLLWNNKMLNKGAKSTYANIDELIYDPDHNKAASSEGQGPEHRKYEEIVELDRKIQVERRKKDVQHGVSIRKKTIFQKIKTSLIHMRKSNSLETTSSTKTLISDRSSGSFCPSCCGEKSPKPCPNDKSPKSCPNKSPKSCTVIKEKGVQCGKKQDCFHRSNSVPVMNTTVCMPPALPPPSLPCTTSTSCNNFQAHSVSTKRTSRKQSADSGNHSWGSNSDDSSHSQCQSCGPYDIYAHVRWDDTPSSTFSSASSRTSSLDKSCIPGHSNTAYYNSWKSSVQYNTSLTSSITYNNRSIVSGVSRQSCDLNDLDNLQGSLKDLLDQIEALKNSSFN